LLKKNTPQLSSTEEKEEEEEALFFFNHPSTHPFIVPNSQNTVALISPSRIGNLRLFRLWHIELSYLFLAKTAVF